MNGIPSYEAPYLEWKVFLEKLIGEDGGTIRAVRECSLEEARSVGHNLALWALVHDNHEARVQKLLERLVQRERRWSVGWCFIELLRHTFGLELGKAYRRGMFMGGDAIRENCPVYDWCYREHRSLLERDEEGAGELDRSIDPQWLSKRKKEIIVHEEGAWISVLAKAQKGQVDEMAPGVLRSGWGARMASDPRCWEKGKEYWTYLLSADYLERGSVARADWPVERVAILGEVLFGTTERGKIIGAGYTVSPGDVGSSLAYLVDGFRAYGEEGFSADERARLLWLFDAIGGPAVCFLARLVCQLEGDAIGETSITGWGERGIPGEYLGQIQGFLRQDFQGASNEDIVALLRHLFLLLREKGHGYVLLRGLTQEPSDVALWQLVQTMVPPLVHFDPQTWELPFDRLFDWQLAWLAAHGPLEMRQAVLRAVGRRARGPEDKNMGYGRP